MVSMEESYKNMVKKVSPKSSIWKDTLFAFLSGGIICMFGQILDTLYRTLGMNDEKIKIAIPITLIIISAILTSFGIYDNIAKFAGAGTIVPITGFANSVVSPAIEFKSEGKILGTSTKMFSIAGPVIVFGTGISFFYGFILWIMNL